MAKDAPTTNDPFQSIRTAIAFSPLDWSEHHRLAWVYGIVVGWEESALRDLKKKFGWSGADVNRLRRLRAAFWTSAVMNKFDAGPE